MKSRTFRGMIFALLIVPGMLWAGDKSQPDKIVDAGSFGLYLKGKRIGTETFSITQNSNGSVTHSQFKTDIGKIPSTSELRLSANGNLVSYDLKGDDGKSHSVIEPSDQILRQTMTYPGVSKSDERQYILPASTVILDDLAFVHIEILVWRYMAETCKGPNCALEAETYGVLIPAEQTSLSIKIAYVGREKINIQGKEMELAHFSMKSESADSELWIDNNQKLVRVLMAANNTEVLRDEAP